MSDLNIELPRLRPYARQGKAYIDELKKILKAEGDAILRDVEAARSRNKGLTTSDICRVALTHRLNLKATFDFLEDKRVLPCGTYDRVKDGGIRPVAAMKEVWAEMQAEQKDV